MFRTACHGRDGENMGKQTLCSTTNICASHNNAVDNNNDGTDDGTGDDDGTFVIVQEPAHAPVQPANVPIEDPQFSPAEEAGIITGIIVGFVVLIVVLCLIMMFITRRRQNAERDPVNAKRPTARFDTIDFANMRLEVHDDDDEGKIE
jgi:hypothetical protein